MQVIPHNIIDQTKPGVLPYLLITIKPTLYPGISIKLTRIKLKYLFPLNETELRERLK